jgi:DNA-binding MarR family transcriptional regulator
MSNLTKIIPYRKSYKAGLLLAKAFRILKKRTNVTLAPAGISATEWGILGLLLEKKSGLKLSEIASEMGVKAPFVTRSINLLIEKNLVLVKVDTVDTRAKIALITESGKTFVKKTETKVMSEVMKVFKGADKRDVLGYVLTLIAIVEANNEAGQAAVDLDHMSNE